VTWEGKDYAEVVAQDWVDSAKYFMTKANASPTANIIYNIVENGADYYNGKVTDFAQVGVKARDKYTVEYTLSKPVPYFPLHADLRLLPPGQRQVPCEQGAKFGTDQQGHALQRRLHNELLGAAGEPASSRRTRNTGQGQCEHQRESSPVQQGDEHPRPELFREGRGVQ